MTINVTQKHIDQGEMVSADCCPIALAVKEKVNIQIYDVYVGNHYVRVQGLGFREIAMPEEAKRFVRSFDNNFGVGAKPFSFELDLPQEILKVKP